MQKLKKVMAEDTSQFVAVYGRRRVGKTFLVREFFDYKFAFTHTGVANLNTRGQLRQFGKSLRAQGSKHQGNPKDWYEAMDWMAELLTDSSEERKVVFLDEVPWMDAPRSSFVSALEHFWNSWASARRNVVLVICGSATSWMIEKVINSHGGLYNRVNAKIHLHQFSLKECQQYAEARNLHWSRRHLAEAYMALGGVPYYWSLMDRSLSMPQNIDALLFQDGGSLREEYHQLYASLFTNPDPYVAIVEALATSSQGITRQKLIKKTGLLDNGKLSRMLQDLAHSGFVRKYCHLNQKSKDALYQLVDNYTLFYHTFIKPEPNPGKNYWTAMIGRPQYNTWTGLAFERLCLRHIDNILDGLGISGIVSNVRSWHAVRDQDKKGAQIDLLIDRADGVISVCEMKYSVAPYDITPSYRETLINKLNRLREEMGENKSLQLVLVASAGLKQNENADIIDHVITLDQLFS